jgi:hypothetical protein
MLVIRAANGAEFLMVHLEARLEVGLQKRRKPMQWALQHGLSLSVLISAI